MLRARTIEDLRADRAAAFAALAEHHLDASYHLAALILGNRAEAEDAAHDAFVAAWKGWGSLRDPDRFEAWFDRILVNACRDRLRRARRHPVIDLSDTLDDRAAPGDAAAAAADRDAIGRSLARLTPDKRTVVVLRFYRDLSIDEIAARVGVPAGTVKSRLHQALRDLGAALGDRLPEVAR
jgi:RNA polymerase sigma-70 factor (ECF subfamily)